MLILEDLYLGDVRPSERSFKRNSQYAKALDEVVRAGDALIGMLYREEDASPEIRELKREVESKKAVLQKRRALFPKL